METILTSKETESEARECWECLKLNMTVPEFQEYIHKIEEGKFITLVESKASFSRWMEKKQ